MSWIFGAFRGQFRRIVAWGVVGLLVTGWALPANGQTLLQRLFPRITGATGSTGSTAPAAPDQSTSQKPLVVDPNLLITPGYCPEVRIPLGGEAFELFDPDHVGDARYARYLITITKTARECLAVTETSITLKLGIAGRVVAGPRGGPGKVPITFRVTVIKQHGNTVMLDKKYTTTVTVGGDLNSDFAHVIDAVTFKRTVLDEDIIVYVGFDIGARPPTG
jgi:hypothetical protein